VVHYKVLQMKLQRLLYSLTFYILLMTVIIMWKPNMLFEPNGEIRTYGVKHGETVFSFGVISIVIAIMCFYVITIIDFLFAP
jgi:hypothetical protein